ncbi:hypothetical protein [Herbidospora galbida]|uniref:hypothetical protein n=1 Tax=Herbidospora galbida TaxID=2575442 RepID=UPI001BAF9C78|nr:hypothetical protein [Herbidospora galbida]
MRAASARILTCLTLLATAMACGQEPPAPAARITEEPRESAVEEHVGVELTLPDGRRVAMQYKNGRGLFEQHYTPETGTWSDPLLIYGTKTDACQSIKLGAENGTVTAIANFGRYCSDGEPPTESVAAVAVGDLGTWEHHLTRKFDGWARATVADDGRKVTFVRNATHVRVRLVWTASDGFSDAVFTYLE